MPTLTVDIDSGDIKVNVGTLHISEARGKEYYSFAYNDEWLLADKRFAIDPFLPLAPGIKNAGILWGAFQDISPDRWGRLLLDAREHNKLTDGEYMTGVSDHMRIGALRLSEDGVYLADNNNIPQFAQLHTFENAVKKYENDDISYAELAMLVDSGSSIGGARPKISIQDDDKLYIAKFSSTKDKYQLIRWEATLLDTARAANLDVANSRLLCNDTENAVLLVERFDRNALGRVHFASAMTLLGGDAHSYLDLADMIKMYSAQFKPDIFEMWKRMTFNALTGNTDDHMRNHAMLRISDGWRLSPAYDLNPVNYDYKKRMHATAFKGQNTPSLGLCIEMGREYFSLDAQQVSMGLNSLCSALDKVESLARGNGLNDNDIMHMEAAFKHEGFEELKRIVSQKHS